MPCKELELLHLGMQQFVFFEAFLLLEEYIFYQGK